MWYSVALGYRGLSHLSGRESHGVSRLPGPETSLGGLLLLRPQLLLVVLHSSVLGLQLDEERLLLLRQIGVILLQELQHLQLLAVQVERRRPGLLRLLWSSFLTRLEDDKFRVISDMRL